MIHRRIDKAPDVPDDFTHLAEYIAAAREEGEKLDQFWIANCNAGADLADLDAAAAEVEAVRMQKPEVANKTYHLVLSLHPGEEAKLDKTALQDIVRHYAEALGFAEHQYVAGSHLNTDNYHVHIAFNRVHPGTFKVHAPYNDFKALEKVSRAMEKKYGLTVDRGMSDPKPEAALSPGARDFEANTWQESFQRHVLEHRTAILQELKDADGWQDAHAVLARYDIRLKPHGAGLVLTDPTGRQTMKASALHRSCGKKSLETRFGPFQPAQFTTEAAGPTDDIPSPEQDSLTPADDDAAAPVPPPEPRPQMEPAAPPPPAPGQEPPPLKVPPVPVARYRPRPLARQPGLAPLWRRYLQQRGRSRPTLLSKVARNWKMFLMMEAYNDPFAFVILMAHKEFLNIVFGEDEPAPPKRISPEIAGALARWRLANRWHDNPETPWRDERHLVSTGTRVDEAGNLVIPFRDATGALQGVRLLAPSGRHLDVGAVDGPAMHVIDPRRTLGPGAPVVVTADYTAAVAIRRATRAPVVVASSDAEVPVVIAALAKMHKGIRPVLAATTPEVTARVSCPRVLLPEKRPPHVLRSLFAAELDDMAMVAWDATIEWAKPSNCAWLKDNGVPGIGVRLTKDGAVAVPLRTLAGRIEDVQVIGADGGTRRVSVAATTEPLVHVIDPRRRLGHGPVVIATSYAEAAAIHRATAAPVVMAGDATQWPEIAKALQAKHPNARVVLATAPEIAATAAADLGVTVIAQPIADLTRSEHAGTLRGVFAEALDDQVFLRWNAARPCAREQDSATHSWLGTGRVTAAARLTDAGDVLLPLRNGDLRLSGLLAVDADGRDRWRLDDLAQNKPDALFHVLGGWLGKNDAAPLVIADDLTAALAVHRDSKATVVHTVGDVAATLTALRKQLPNRRMVLASSGAAPDGLEIERLPLPHGSEPGGNRDRRRQIQAAIKAAGLEPRSLKRARPAEREPDL
ncbi:MAG: TraI/MobA(P) family conjugative relaxase [Rhodospirillaceae bacterium]